MQEFSLESYLSGNTLKVELSKNDTVTSWPEGNSPLWNYLKHSARAHREVRPASHENIEQSLRSLAAFVRFMSGSGIEWYFTGGIAIDMIKRTTFREHGDLDIVLPISEAPKLKEFIRKKHAATYRRLSTANYYKDNRLTVYKRTLPNESDFGKCNTLKLFLSSRKRMLPVVDFHFISPNKRGSLLLWNKQIISLPFPLKGNQTFHVEGEKVTCCDLRYILFLKSDNNPRNHYDAARVAEELSPKEVARVMALRRMVSPQNLNSGILNPAKREEKQLAGNY